MIQRPVLHQLITLWQHVTVEDLEAEIVQHMSVSTLWLIKCFDHHI